MRCAPPRDFLQSETWLDLTLPAKFAYASLCYLARAEGRLFRTEATLHEVAETVRTFSGMTDEVIETGVQELESTELVRRYRIGDRTRFTLLGPLEAANWG